jgi:hypothetical protein
MSSPEKDIAADTTGQSRHGWLDGALIQGEIEGPITVSRSPVPEEAFDSYEGQWITIRDCEVVAHADTFEELTEHQNYSLSDALFRVPLQNVDHYYLAV